MTDFTPGLNTESGGRDSSAAIARRRKQIPRLTLGPLTGRIYIVTRFREMEGGIIEALEKHDVTNDFLALYDEATSKFTYTETTGGGRSHG